MIGEISVVFVIALMRMMLQVINAKAHRAGRKVREISNDSYHFVPAFAPEDQIMCCIMDDHVIGMVGERTDAISDEQTEPPKTKSERAHPIRDGCLCDHDRQRDERRVRIAHHQLANFRVRFDESPRPTRVRLIKLGLVEEGLH